MWWKLQGSLSFSNKLRQVLREKEYTMRAKNRHRRLAGKRKLFVVGDERYDLPIHIFGEPEFELSKFLDNPRSFSAVLLPGGEDIHPAMYGHHKHKKCGFTSYIRDQKEVYAGWVAIINSVPLIGICRGAQILNALSGGTLIQHCDNHGFWHDLETTDGNTITVSSTHHQMMLPPTMGQDHNESRILAWASPRQSTEYYDQYGKLAEDKIPELEPDVIHFPKINAIGFQYHPEYMEEGSDAIQYFQEKLQTVLGLEVVRKRHMGDYVCLPKEPQTVEKAEEYEAFINSLSKKDLNQYYIDHQREEFMDASKRRHMALLYDEDEAEELAEEEYNDYMESINEQLLAQKAAKGGK